MKVKAAVNIALWSFLAIMLVAAIYFSNTQAQQESPVASFTYSPTNPKVNETIVFDAGASYAYNQGYIIAYNWTFGDGSSIAGYNSTVVEHAYRSEGVYTVTLTVMDNYERIGIKTENIIVGELTREARPLYVVAVVGLGLTTVTSVLTNLSSVGQSFNAAISRLPIPDQLKEFFKFYGEKVFETADHAELGALAKKSFITKGELVAFGLSAGVMTIVYSFVEANGLSGFLNPSILAVVIPATFLSVCLVLVTSEIFEVVCARAFSVYRQFRLWLYGLAAFLISGFVLLFPFSTPGITRYQGGGAAKRTIGLIMLSKMLFLLALAIPFTLLSMFGYKIIGDAGLLLTLMTTCYSLIPLKFLPGKAILDYRKEVSLAAFVSVLILFVGQTMYFLPRITFLVAGIVSAFLMAIVMIKLALIRRTEEGYFPPPPPPEEILPPPPPPPPPP